MKYARIVNNIVVDVSDNPSENFHPDLAAEFVQVADDVCCGWSNATGELKAPDPVVEQGRIKVVGVQTFLMLWTRAERVKARELRTSDADLEDIWSRIEDTRTTEVNLALTSVQDDIEYTLGALKDAGLDLDVATRKAAILSGIVS